MVRSVGTDAVDVARFRAVLGRRPALADRLFTAAELARARRRRDPVPTLAARFAAKEAVAKALGTGIGGVRWRDIEVDADLSGAPLLVLTGRAAALAATAGICRWHVSLTHTDVVAMAVVLAEGAAADQDGPAPAAQQGSVVAGPQPDPAGQPAGARPDRAWDEEGMCSRW